MGFGVGGAWLSKAGLWRQAFGVEELDAQGLYEASISEPVWQRPPVVQRGEFAALPAVVPQCKGFPAQQQSRGQAQQRM